MAVKREMREAYKEDELWSVTTRGCEDGRGEGRMGREKGGAKNVVTLVSSCVCLQDDFGRCKTTMDIERPCAPPG